MNDDILIPLGVIKRVLGEVPKFVYKIAGNYRTSMVVDDFVKRVEKMKYEEEEYRKNINNLKKEQYIEKVIQRIQMINGVESITRDGYIITAKKSDGEVVTYNLSNFLGDG